MRLPSYRFIQLNQESFTQTFAEFRKYEFFESPIVFDLLNEEDEVQEIILIELSRFLQSLNITNVPYRAYTLTNSNLNLPLIISVKNKILLPGFHKRKKKSLNVRESSLLNKITLKQKKLSQMSINDYQAAIEIYSDSHKQIYKKQKLLNFMIQIGENNE